MAQHDYNIANQGFPAFRTDLNNALSAIQTTNSGTSRPTGAVAGQLWLDTTSATTPTLKYYDGADDISLATIDHSANTVNWLDSTVSITGLSTTATGTVLTLSDSATTSTVNLIIDNDKEIRFREATANGTNYVSLSAPASLSADLTFTLPSADGTNGQVLSTNGSGVLSFITPSAGVAFQSAIKTSGFTAVAGEGYFCNTTSSAFTVTLPASPSAGNQIAIVDYAGTFATNNITLAPNGNKINGSTDNRVLNTTREGVIITYIDSTQGWVASSGVNEGTVALSPPPYTVDFLVIAGGGSGGSHFRAGGGGAGGYRNSYSTETSGGGGSSEASLSFSTGTVYTVTVGAGATSSSSGLRGNNGNNSSISGTGISTITSTGGGGGGLYDENPNSNGISGGSGGGAGNSEGRPSGLGGSGTANQGFDGGSSQTAGVQLGGGGGGSGAVGFNAGSSGTGGTDGDGGAGLASSITGSSITRSGGGGGGNYGGRNVTVGGTGGGGAGGSGSTPYQNGVAGTANTGSGGGGASGDPSTGQGGAGGSGVVILRMPTASYSGTTTGSPTVTTSGADTILVFNSSGSITG
jgi:hypothetical protein